MNILLTNDDGIYAQGLWALHHCLSGNHRVFVIAPDRERTAVGHGITLHTPLRATRISRNEKEAGIAVNGTPADCIKLGILELLELRPDLVISGINPGANVGININYSGTVSAAREAALFGLPAIAVSMEGNNPEHLSGIARFIEQLAEHVLERGLPFGTFLNVNIPEILMEDVAGIRVCRQSVSLLSEYFEKRNDPRNRTYYWQGCDTGHVFDNPDTDGAALGNKYISITPIKCDMTDYSVMEDLKTWEIRVPGKNS
ncbi:MAG: 5'/3'-nucleotidase SurE [Pseudomonadota bacterium]